MGISLPRLADSLSSASHNRRMLNLPVANRVSPFLKECAEVFGRDLQWDAFLLHPAYPRGRRVGQHLVYVLLSPPRWFGGA
jgi:hypothetical protein